jgi:hypothetical protein
MIEYYYRAFGSYQAEQMVVVVDRLQVVRKTPQGVWIGDFSGRTRWVRSSLEGKAYAKPTEAGALTSLKKRTLRRVLILQEQLRRSHLLLETIQSGGTPVQLTAGCCPFEKDLE